MPLRYLRRADHHSFSWIPIPLLALSFCDDKRIRADHRTEVMLQSCVQSPLIRNMRAFPQRLGVRPFLWEVRIVDDKRLNWTAT